MEDDDDDGDDDDGDDDEGRMGSVRNEGNESVVENAKLARLTKAGTGEKGGRERERQTDGERRGRRVMEASERWENRLQEEEKRGDDWSGTE